MSHELLTFPNVPHLEDFQINVAAREGPIAATTRHDPPRRADVSAQGTPVRVPPARRGYS